MAKDSYKKRMKGGWHQGKRCKGDGEERIYARAEIRQFIKEMDEDYQQPYKKSKRRRNEKARLEHKIAWCEAALARRPNARDVLSSWIQEDLEKAKKLYEEKYASAHKSQAIRERV